MRQFLGAPIEVDRLKGGYLYTDDAYKAFQFPERGDSPARRFSQSASNYSEPGNTVGTSTFESFRDPIKGGGVGPEMVRLPAGDFLMGSAEGSPWANSRERPQHRVRIPGPIAIGRFPVTFEEYDRFCADTKAKPPKDQGWGRGRRPAIGVTWHDAVAYCVWLNAQTGQTYRLPSEAEWEYACRAGTVTAWSFGDDESALGEHAWFRGNSEGRTHPVGEKRPNPWRLHDMHGNVWEWVHDCWYQDYGGAPDDGAPWLEAYGGDCARRVVRGGGWFFNPDWLRSADRYRGPAGVAILFLGFRLARTL